ncbi:MAG: DUF559 domain-containing protein [Microbacteriaceae bacterium]|nr:MAG: DUF559 domain-containing protein [Microbacteriaceae bacterium]
MTTTDEQETARDRVSRLFQFVRDINQLRNPIQRQIRELPWTLSLAALPHHACVALGTPPSPTVDSESKSEAEDSDFVLRVERPTLDPVPKPPAEIADWLQGGWDRCDGAVAVVTPRYNGDPENPSVEQFDDDQTRIDALASWTTLRQTFLDTHRPAFEAFRLFERLYELRGIMERDAERYEIILGDGILCWNIQSGSIRFPVVLQRLELQFDASVPRFTLTDASTPTEFNSVLFRSIASVDGSIIGVLKAELAAGQCHPLTQEALSAFLKSVPPRLAVGGRFLESAPATDTVDPTLYRAPIIFLRRRTFGFADALEKIVEDIENNAELPKSLINIVGLGDLGADIDSEESSRSQAEPAEERGAEVLFTKAANEEQYRIAETLSRHSCVIVQGPPGTGKTHTIANMVGHLLAQGKSVLVTSTTTKALRVLREKVVPKLKSLCVSVLESDAQGNDQLKASIDSIVERMSTSTEVGLTAAADIYAEEQKSALDELGQTKQKLLQARFADSQPVLVGGDSFPAIKAAKRVADGAVKHSWIPGPVASGAALTITPEEVRTLYRTNGTVPPSIEKELSHRLPDPAAFPDPHTFTRLVEETLATADQDLPYKKYWNSSQVGEGIIETLLSSLSEVLNQWGTADSWLFVIGNDGYRGGGHIGTWSNLFHDVEHLEELVERTRDTLVRFGPKLAADIDLEEQLHLFDEILKHLAAGGNLGFVALVTRPRWKDLIAKVSVNGRPPKSVDDYQALQALASLESARSAVDTRWTRQVVSIGGPVLPTTKPEEMAGALLRKARWALRWHAEVLLPFQNGLETAGFLWSEAVGLIPTGSKPSEEFEGLVRLCDAVLPSALRTRLTMLRHEDCIRELSKLMSEIQSFSGDTVARLATAVAFRSDTDYESAYRDLICLVDSMQELDLRRALLRRLSVVAPAWTDAVAKRLPPHDAISPPGEVEAAWLWMQLSQQLGERDKACLQDLDRELQDKTDELHAATAELADARAWLAQRRRTGLAQQQALVGYQLAIKKIGKGTGKRVPILRKQARELMEQAKTAVPVWIMPLIRVAENYDPRTTKFDVVIIDEASQSDVTGLIALYYGRQILVVGDDEQVSPEAVGQNLTETQHLIDEHLYGLPNAQLYDGRASIYDVAKQAFGGTICLREHFRCVPEIILFSNHYSYDDKMVLLRESSESNLLPHVVAHRVAGSSNEKVNQEEADEIVALIMACNERPEYDGKSFGVISLVGEDQARTIETLLRKRLEPRVLEERRLLCGNSAQFQGDERDVMFLSMVDSPRGTPLPIRDDPIFKKRFNVAASRARDQMWLIYSLDPANDVRSGDLRRRLIEHALDPTALSTRIAVEEKKAQSDFERDVLRCLITAGYRATAQYPIGSYHIDILIEGAGRKRLAVECDGEQYHTMLELEHDLERQSLLERVGLTFHRIRGASYYRNPELEIIRLVEHLTIMEIMPFSQGPATAEPSDDPELKKRVLARAVELRLEFDNAHDYDYYRQSREERTPPSATTSRPVDVPIATIDAHDQAVDADVNGAIPPERTAQRKAQTARPFVQTAQRPALFDMGQRLALEPEAIEPSPPETPSGPSLTRGEHARMDSINETLHLKKETKGTFCFESDVPDAPVPTLYVRKSAFPNGKAPPTIRITVQGQ